MTYYVGEIEIHYFLFRPIVNSTCASDRDLYAHCAI